MMTVKRKPDLPCYVVGCTLTSGNISLKMPCFPPVFFSVCKVWLYFHFKQWP